jgi:hypothetical protein
MERSLLDTMSLLGLDIMLGAIVALLVLAAADPVLRHCREARTTPEVESLDQRERGEPQPAGYVPSLTVGFVPVGEEQAEPEAPRWFRAWMRGASGKQEPASASQDAPSKRASREARRDEHEPA